MTESEKKEQKINVEELNDHELEELYNFEQKQKRKKKKRRKILKLQNNLSDFSGDEEIQRRKEASTIWANINIPPELKEKYVQYECNPLVIVVGNIPLNAARQEIEEYFKTLILALSPPCSTIFQPIKKVEIGETKNFAVIELVNKDIKKICSQLEMLEYNGFKLQVKISKPRGFFDKIYNHSKEGGIDPFGNVTTTTPQEDNKIYLGGLPTYLKDHDVRKLCESYGTLKYFKLQTENLDGEIRSKGYCFFEYSDGKITDKAASVFKVKGLNGLEIGDRKIKVSRASSNQKMIENKKNLGPASNSVKNSLLQNVYQGGSYVTSYSQIKQAEIQVLLNIPSYTTIPSKVMQILNMASAEDLQDDDFYNDLIEDLMEECSKFGTIENLVIPRPLQDGSLCQAVGKIFIKYSTLKNSKVARYNLNGRTYNNRTIICSYYPESLFDSQDYLKNL